MRFSILLATFMAIVCGFSASSYAGAGHLRNYAWGKIKSRDGACLEAVNDRFSFRPCSSSKNQDWILTGEDQLRSRASDDHLVDECIDVPSESNARVGTELQKWRCNDSVTMKWRIDRVGAGNNLLFHVKTFKNMAMCMTNMSGKNVALGTCNTTNQAQLFTLESGFSNNPFDAFPKVGLKVNGIDVEHWMEQIYAKNSATLLTKIAIPGTHDSGTYTGFGSISKTQSRSIYNQLKDGNRYVDLRIGDNGKIVHGIDKGPSGSLDAVLKDLRQFASTHPKEIIFVDLHEIPESTAELSRLKNAIFATIGPYLVSSAKSAKQLSFQELWANPGRNIILLVKNYANAAKVFGKEFIFNKSLGASNRSFINSRNLNWEEVWPDSTNFKDVYDKNRVGLEKRADDKWHMSQLLRTPRVSDAIFSVVGIKGGVSALTSEKTNDGHFAQSLGKWVFDWWSAGLGVNFVATDFYERSTLVETLLWLNIARQ